MYKVILVLDDREIIIDSDRLLPFEPMQGCRVTGRKVELFFPSETVVLFSDRAINADVRSNTLISVRCM